MIQVLIPLVCFGLGLWLGLILKGIHIHVHKDVPSSNKKEEYNPSLANLLPQEVQQYYSSTNGQNRF
jgi:hypothetical protein